jgi:endonuclease-3
VNQSEKILQTIKVLQKETEKMVEPAASGIVRLYGRKPFLILTSCILSLRTKDTVSLPASIRLFALGMTPEQLVKVPLTLLEKAIYPVGFYRQKSVQLHKISQQLLKHHNGQVPSTQNELLGLTGVGPKTANLVLSEGFLIPALCVDTHVHRISNRLGWVTTKTPEQTEQELKKIVPRQYWIALNGLFVMWGQNQCVPLSPFCSTCPLKSLCPKKVVIKSR